MKIEYDDYYKCYVVWVVQGSAYFEAFHGLKKDCKNFIKKNTKRERKRNEYKKSN